MEELVSWTPAPSEELFAWAGGVHDRPLAPSDTLDPDERDRRDRIAEVTRIIDKRVGAPIAAECYVDHSPPPPEVPDLLVARRDRGSGRPTKRERRQLEKWLQRNR